ncbi:unnamed protein product [Brassicogethes aeneus]|uniref:F-box domain-containing protein n=1 Tax=Brassicogethes aeneus TaxID=1431903 RepID=A0A9P0B6D3_BRAAE|nr:unnamed protein product [Brassicogethes aeneus]
MDSTTIEEGPPRKKVKSLREKGADEEGLSTLPDDVLIKIFSYLDLKSISKCAMLCSRFNNISKYGTLYKKVHLKYNMNFHILKSLISKATCPKILVLEYMWYTQHPYSDSDDSEAQDYSEFNKYVKKFFKQSGDQLKILKVESCRCNDVLLSLSECRNLEKLELYRCKGTFATLPSLGNLKSIHFLLCDFLLNTVVDVIKNNGNLRKISLADNTNVNVDQVCETMSQHCLLVTSIYLSERKKIKTKSLKTLKSLSNLRSLELICISKSKFDLEDTLEQLAAGCPKLQKLAIYGWKEINDDNFIPALHMLTQLKELDLKGTNITIKSCREAALTLPKLKSMDVIKMNPIKKAELAKLQKEFPKIDIALDK